MSLGDDEDDRFFDVDEEIAEAAGINEDYRQVPDPSCYSDTTNALLTAAWSERLGFASLCNPVTVACAMNKCRHARDYAACTTCKGKGKVSHHHHGDDAVAPTWLLDSAA